MYFKKIVVTIIVFILVGSGLLVVLQSYNDMPRTLKEAVYEAYGDSDSIRKIEEVSNGKYRYIIHYKDDDKVYITKNGVQSYNNFLSDIEPLRFSNQK